MEHGARSTEHGARSTEHGARSTEHGARSTEHGTRNTEHGTRNTQHAACSTQHGSILIHTSTYRSCVRMIKYIVFNWKVEICSTREFSSVLRAPCKCESNNGNSLILFVRAACKYELAFSLQIQHVQMYSTITVSLYVRYTYTVCANTYTRTVGANTVHTDTVGKSMGTQEKWKIQIRKYESCIEVDAYNNRMWFYWK